MKRRSPLRVGTGDANRASVVDFFSMAFAFLLRCGAFGSLVSEIPRCKTRASGGQMRSTHENEGACHQNHQCERRRGQEKAKRQEPLQGAPVPVAKAPRPKCRPMAHSKIDLRYRLASPLRRPLPGCDRLNRLVRNVPATLAATRASLNLDDLGASVEKSDEVAERRRGSWGLAYKDDSDATSYLESPTA